MQSRKVPYKLVVVAIWMMAACSAAAAQELDVNAGHPTADSLFQAARMAVHETRFESADDLLRQVVEAEPDFRLGWAYLAMVDMLLFRSPEGSIAEARKINEGGSIGEREMIEILIQFASGNLEDAEQRIFGFFKTYPDDRYANHMLGFVSTDLGRPEEGVETLREVIRTHPDYYPAWNHLGYAFLESGDLAKAEAAFGMFMELSPDNPSAYDSMAEYLARAGDVDGAIGHLQRAVELEPRMAFAWMHMGDILAESGSPDRAEDAYRQAIESSTLYGDEFRDVISSKIEELEIE
jgi:Flp pilus assembly protein TadD